MHTNGSNIGRADLRTELEARVRRCKRAAFIRLEKGNSRAKECFDQNCIYIGYHTGRETLQILATEGPGDKWERLKDYLEIKGVSRGRGMTRALDQMRSVIDDDGETLWFTFYGTKLYWTFVEPSIKARTWDGNGGGRRETLRWRSSNLRNEEIHSSKVSTRISQVQGYMQTVRSYVDKEDESDSGFNPVSYLRNLILGDPQPATLHALQAEQSLRTHCRSLIKRLTDKEFENFVDLIFVADGWLRTTEVGGLQKDIDGEYIHATTGLIAKVQVKSKTNANAIQKAQDGFFKASGSGTLLYWIYHTAPEDTMESAGRLLQLKRYDRNGTTWLVNDAQQITFAMLDADLLAELAVKKGLAHWLIQKAA